MIAHLCNRTMTVWRRLLTEDDGGGQVTTWAEIGDVAVRISQPTVQERVAAQQLLGVLTHVAYAEPATDIQRGDELRDPTLTLRVMATLVPSAPAYLRCECEERQPNGGE
ncbi:phage head completion protein [Amycolatopsis palatopharyngis]|uniref:phage head completion protein n=1 Tax=Amycolatopsis palatopharyngis TaxID=187982 RepID=UPI001B86B82B|nr:head-tail adaptor protein [Amycolatopsis palatopharyngis]